VGDTLFAICKTQVNQKLYVFLGIVNNLDHVERFGSSIRAAKYMLSK